MDLFERLLGATRSSLTSDVPVIGGNDTDFVKDVVTKTGRVLSSKSPEEEENLSSFTDELKQTILKKREVLSTLAYFIGKDFDLTVKVGAPGSGWFWEPASNSVTIDSKDVLENPIGFLRFVTSHEGAHKRISRLGEANQQSLEESGFMMLLNAVEDPRVNNYICDTYPLLEGDMDVAYDLSFRQCEEARAKALKEMGFYPDSLDASFAIIRNWYFERYLVDAPQSENPVTDRTKEFLEKTHAACQRAYSTYPSKKEADSGEKAVKKYSKAAYRVINDDIWPEFKKLLSQDEQEANVSQAIQELIKDAQDKASQQSPGQGSPQGAKSESPSPDKNSETNPSNSQDSKGKDTGESTSQNGQPGELGEPPQGTSDQKPQRKDGSSERDSQDEKNTDGDNKDKGQDSEKGSGAKDGQGEEGSKGEKGGSQGASGNQPKENKSQEGQQQGQGSGYPSDESDNQSQTGSNGKGSQSQESLAKYIQSELEGKTSTKAQGELNQQINQASEDAANHQSKSPGEYYSKLSDEVKKELRELFEKLPQSLKDKIKERAAQKMSEVYDEIAKELEGKLGASSPTQEPSKYTGNLGEVGEDPIEGRKGGIRTDFTNSDEFRGFKSQVEKVFAKSRNVYEKERLAVVDIINRLEKDMRALFQERHASHYEKGRRSGPNINLNKRISEVASGVSPVDTKAFIRKTKPLEKDYAITILVDLSASMQHDRRIQQTFKAVIVLSEVLNRLGIKFEVIGFNDRLHEYKKFSEKLSDHSRDRLGAMLGEVKSSRARYNDDGWAISEASQRLSKESGSVKFLLVLSDGQPLPSDPHATSEYELSKIITAVRSKGDQVLIGLGLGSGTSHVSNYYPNSIANISTADLPAKLSELLELALREPEKFRL